MAAALRHPLRHAAHLARRWAYRRQGRDSSPVRLHRRRIYILPTRAGLGLAMVVAAMILAAMNYANSMGFALAFLLVGLALVSMHHCHRQLTGLVVRSGPPGRGFVGEAQTLTIQIESDDRISRMDLLLTDENGNPRDVGDLPSMGRLRLNFAVTPARRGPFHQRRFGIESRYPFGLFRAWCWLDLPLEGLAWPRPVTAPLQRADDPDDANGRREQKGTEDFTRLRPYVGGDPVGRMLWRHYLSHGELIVKEFASPAGESPVWFDWENSGDDDRELRLGRLTHWLLQAEASERSWGLRLQALEIGPGKGRQQTRQALDALALFQRESVAND